MKKSELRKIIREEAKHLMNESNRNIGHYTDRGRAYSKEYYVDSTFINLSKGILPGSSLEHMGFGEFYLQTPEGNVDFIRTGDSIEGFVGRAHKLRDSKNGKLVDALIKGMVKAKKAEEV